MRQIWNLPNPDGLQTASVSNSDGLQIRPTANGKPVNDDQVSLRLGFRLIKGLPQASANILSQARGSSPYRSISDCARRTRLGRALLARLAAADAFGSLGHSRRAAIWHVLSLGEELPLFAGLDEKDDTPALPQALLDDEVVADYDSTGLSLKAHPIGLLRSQLDALEVLPASVLAKKADKDIVRVAGLVLVRQAPPTAKGAVFITLEDETGIVNLVVWANVWKRYRRIAHAAVALFVQGRVEKASGVIHVAALRLEDLSETLRGLPSRSCDFR
jgi:error-prone DNA polymerase